MATIQKFYLHAASATPPNDQLPSPVTARSPNALTGDGFQTMSAALASNAAMDGNIGVLQTSIGSAVSAAAADVTFWMRCMSDPLAAQTIASGTWTISAAWSLAIVGGTNHTGKFVGGYIAVWRPTAHQIVGVIIDAGATYAVSATTTTAETAFTQTYAGGSLAIQNGDVLLLELFVSSTTGTLSTSTTPALYFDGTTEANTASCASFLNAPAALTLGTAHPPIPPTTLPILQGP